MNADTDVVRLCAWYLHLRAKQFDGQPFGLKVLLLGVAFSWGIAFFEYLLQVPANSQGGHAPVTQMVSIAPLAAFPDHHK